METNKQMKNYRILDLFCGAGGAGMGYHRAGFEVVGVDIAPQSRYPFTFIQADATTFPIDTNRFDAIHASPPCQAFSTMTRRNNTQHLHPKLIDETRAKLQAAGLPYIIENVPGCPLHTPVTLCGTMFGLRLKRHRLFEASFRVAPPQPCDHKASPQDIPILNHGAKLTRFVPVYGSPGGKAGHLWNAAMGIDWMKKHEIAEAIPPAYTEHIGRRLRCELETNEVD